MSRAGLMFCPASQTGIRNLRRGTAFGSLDELLV
jgi:hypothetical protein